MDQSFALPRRIATAFLLVPFVLALGGCLEQDLPGKAPGIDPIPPLKVTEGSRIDLESYAARYVHGAPGQSLELLVTGWGDGSGAGVVKICDDRGRHEISIRARSGDVWYGHATFEMEVEPDEAANPPEIADGKSGQYRTVAGQGVTHRVRCAVRGTSCATGLDFVQEEGIPRAARLAEWSDAQGAEAEMTWVPGPADRGLHHMKLRCTDGSRGDDAEFDVEVENQPPVFSSSPPTQALCGGRTWTYPVQTEDADGDPVTLSLLQGPPGLMPVTQGIFQWVPTAGGTYTAAIAALDDHGGSSTQVVTIQVWSGCIGGKSFLPPLQEPRENEGLVLAESTLTAVGGDGGWAHPPPGLPFW